MDTDSFAVDGLPIFLEQTERLKAALQGMAPGVMETAQLDYLREHLRILSGFYGLLRPFDGATPYWLEMQAKLSVNGRRDLYGFRGDALAQQLAAETDSVLNLASKEYSRAVEPHLPKSVRFLTCTFGEQKDGKVIEKGTMCKRVGLSGLEQAQHRLLPVFGCRAHGSVDSLPPHWRHTVQDGRGVTVLSPAHPDGHN